MEKKIKRFRSQKEQILYLIILTAMICFWSWIVVDVIIKDEFILRNEILGEKLYGGAKQQGITLLQQWIISVFGKNGFFVFVSMIEIILINEYVSIFSTYRRFKKREREIREGLRAPDDYVDDYVRVPLWRKVANLFTKKRKKEYPSEREMRDSLKKNKYYKE